MDRLIDPSLADIHIEYGDALRQGRRWRARWVQLAGYVGLLKVIVWCGAKGLFDYPPGARQVLIRTIAFAAVITGVLTLLFAIPALANNPARTGVPYWKALPYLVPSALPLAIPMGFVLGIVCGTVKEGSRGPSLNMIVLLTMVCTAAVFADLIWIVPN
jgi:hypothetical protein